MTNEHSKSSGRTPGWRDGKNLLRNGPRQLGLSRRDFARTVGIGALALPFLRTLRGQAQAGAAPKRFLVFFSPNGTIPEEFFPDGGETDFRFRRILEPLAPFRDKVIVLRGVDQTSSNSGPGDGHQVGMGHLLTGRELLPGDTMGGCDSCPPVSWASGISIDQRIANEIGATTPFRSVELGARVSGSNIWTRMCYRSASEPIPPEIDPVRAFERLFAGVEVDTGEAERRLREGRSVLDAVQQDFAALQRRVGRDDRARLETHLEVVRELELRLGSSMSTAAECRVPMLGDRVDPGRNENFPRLVEMQMDVMAAAFACGLTNVGSLQWTQSVGNIPFNFDGVGVERRHHDLSHYGDGDLDAREDLIRINRWYAQRYAEMLARLDRIPEGGGSVLDNTVVVWVNELGKGNSHTRRDMPFVLGGSAGGALRTGRSISYSRRPHNDLWVTILRAFGIGDSTFGDTRFNTGAMSEILV